MLRIAGVGLNRRLTEVEKRIARAEFWKEVATILAEGDRLTDGVGDGRQV